VQTALSGFSLLAANEQLIPITEEAQAAKSKGDFLPKLSTDLNIKRICYTLALTQVLIFTHRHYYLSADCSKNGIFTYFLHFFAHPHPLSSPFLFAAVHTLQQHNHCVL
jgi:hypothetical protein